MRTRVLPVSARGSPGCSRRTSAGPPPVGSVRRLHRACGNWALATATMSSGDSRVVAGAPGCALGAAWVAPATGARGCMRGCTCSGSTAPTQLRAVSLNTRAAPVRLISSNSGVSQKPTARCTSYQRRAGAACHWMPSVRRQALQRSACRGQASTRPVRPRPNSTRPPVPATVAPASPLQK